MISRHDGSLIPVVASPLTTVDLWVQYIEPAAQAEHFGYNPGPHTHGKEEGEKAYFDKNKAAMLHETGAWPPQNEPHSSHHLPRPDPRQCLKERERAKHDQNIHAFIPQCNDHGGYM